MKSISSLSDRFFAVYAIWQVVGILSYMAESVSYLYFFGMIFLTFITVMDRQSLLKKSSLEGHLEGKKSYEISEKINLKLKLIFHRSFLRQPSRIYWNAPDTQQILFQSTRELIGKLSKEEEGYEACHKGKANQLGYCELKSANLTSISQLGFWSDNLELPVPPIDFRVHPPEGQMTDSEFIEKVSRQPIFSSGIRRRLKSRSADQFYSIRKYQYPDPKRYIDAKKSAKYSQLMTRTYEEYRSHHLILALDCSRNLLGKIDGSPKMDFYLSACLKLIENAIGNGDEVSLIVFSDHIHYMVRSAKSAQPFQHLYRDTKVVRATSREPNYELLLGAVPQVAQQRSMLFVLTDPSMPIVHRELKENLFPLCMKHFVLVIGLSETFRILNNYVNDLSPKDFDLESYGRLLYNLNIENDLQLLQLKLNFWGAGVVRSEPDNLLGLSKKAYDHLRSSLSS